MMEKKNNEVLQNGQEVETTEAKEETRKKKSKKSVVLRWIALIIAIILGALYIVIGLEICTTRAYNDAIFKFGDGPVNYTDEAYYKIKEALEGTEKLEEELEKEKEKEKEKGNDFVVRSREEKIEACLTENVGLDIKRFRTYVTDYELRSEGKNTILKAWITEGSFKAEITVTMDENYHVIEDKTKRNYENKQHYMTEFYNMLRDYAILNGLREFGVISVLLILVVSVLVGIFIIFKAVFSKIKKRKKEMQGTTEQKENLQEQDSTEQKENLQEQDSIEPKEELQKQNSISTEENGENCDTEAQVSDSNQMTDTDKKTEASE